MTKIYEMELAGRRLVVETGQLAQFANGSCLVRYGDTAVLSTATSSTSPRPGIDFFPLSVDYEEKMYAVGRFPGGFLKREGRPTENAVLTSRAIDRPMRPLFPDDLRNDVAIANLVLSVDQDAKPEFCAMLGSSISVSISDIPWNGPTASVFIGLIDGKAVINPTEAERELSQMEVILSGTEEKICMIEAGANEVPDDVMLEAIKEGHKVIQELCRFIKNIVSEIGKSKYEYESKVVDAELMQAVIEIAGEGMKQAVLNDDKSIRDLQVNALTEEVLAKIEATNQDWLPGVKEAMYQLQKKTVRAYLKDEGKRVDGRGLNDIRPLSAAVGMIPRTHGSGLFQRGQTQVLTTTTLAPMSKVQKLDGLADDEESKRYIHHYNFPGYSVGEAKNSRSPGRREIGHGALAERSLVPVLPEVSDFPYAIRTVSEILMSNGSTSQGSVCASTLSLMDAGVPIKRPVAGISAGLITNEQDDNDYLVFMDIQGIEDFFGDMDFKVAGTTEGITSIQVDIKVNGLTFDVIRDAFEMTRKGRLQIINEVILPVLAEPRAAISPYAPKIVEIKIDPEKIGDVIGKSGKVINKIIELTDTEIDIEEDGQVFVSGIDAEKVDTAIAIIRGIVTDPEPGQVYQGQVTRLMTFGAFVEYLPGKEGLVHISKLDWGRVDKVEDVLAVGDAVTVKVLEVDDQGRINLSIRDTLPKPEGWTEPERQERPQGDRRDNNRGRNDRGPRRDDRGPRRDDRGPRRDDRGPRRDNEGGPRRDNEGGHFRD